MNPRNHKKSIEVNAHGFIGRGPTKTAAKKDLKNQIATALNGDYLPMLINCLGYTTLIFRTPQLGWCYTILKPADTSIKINIDAYWLSQSQIDTFEFAERQARRDLAKVLFGEIADIDAAALIHEETDRRAFLDWCDWRHCYTAWKNTNADENTARNNANRHVWPEG